ncbi:MAG: nuclear transport factor 2 family protein [Myxococcales bacterium]
MTGAQTDEEVTSTLIEMERAALQRWGNGDPSGYLEISAHDVVYFDPTLEARLNNHDELTRHYDGVRGKISIERHELINPRVQRVGDAAVLTFNYVSHGGNENKMRWNCTEVFRKDPVGWRIISTHWSLTKTM